MSSFLISADGQTDGLCSYMECQGRGETVRLTGLAVLGSLYCSVHAASLGYRSCLDMSEN